VLADPQRRHRERFQRLPVGFRYPPGRYYGRNNVGQTIVIIIEEGNPTTGAPGTVTPTAATPVTAATTAATPVTAATTAATPVTAATTAATVAG